MVGGGFFRSFGLELVLVILIREVRVGGRVRFGIGGVVFILF